MAAFEAWLVFLILVVNVVGELQRKRTLAASRGFLAAARLSCYSRVRTGWLRITNFIGAGTELRYTSGCTLTVS